MIAAAGVIAIATLPIQIGPDAAGYLAVASAIQHGLGLVYPDGAPILERPPLFAALSAIGGGSGASLASAGSLISKLGFVAFAAALSIGASLACAAMSLVARTTAGVVAGLAVVLSPLFVEWQGALLIDGLQAAIALTAVAVWPTRPLLRSWRPVASGALLGLAVLVKESAVLLLVIPLGLELWTSNAGMARRLGAGAAAFATVVGPWWTWVALHTGRVYLVGLPTVLVVALAAVLVVLGLIWRVVRTRASDTAQSSGASIRIWGGDAARQATMIVVTSVWIAVGVLGLEATADQPVSRSLPSALLRYARLTLDPGLPLFPIALAPIAVGAFLAIREPRLRPYALALAASLPLLEFTAARGWQARNIILVIGPGAVLAGSATAWFVDRIALWGGPWRLANGRGAAIAALGLISVTAVTPIREAVSAVDPVRQRSAAETWNRPEVRFVAEWLAARAAPGDTVLASWRFGASWFYHGNALFQVRQVPLLRVSFRSPNVPDLQTISTFDRWEDERLRVRDVGTLVASGQDRFGEMIALERQALQDVLDTTRPRWLVLVTGGPTLRDAARYPNLPALLGATGPELEVETGSGTISIFALPPDAAGRLAAYPVRGDVALTGDVATALASGTLEEVAARLANLGIAGIMVTDGVPLSSTAEATYRNLGVEVALIP